MMEVEEIQAWLFYIEPLPGVSLSHFIGQFRRANNLTLAALGKEAGFGGVIMIETKKGSRLAAGEKSNFNSEGFQLFRLRGFSPELTFQNSLEPEEAPVNKPTIYWNPAANTLENLGVFSFKVKIPVEVKTMNIYVEGTTAEGFPFAKMFKVSDF